MQDNTNADLEKQLQGSRTQLAELARELQTERTKRQQVEEALRETERRFRAVFEQTFQFTGLLTTEGILLEANQAALDFGGIQAADVVGCPFWETQWWTISPETQEQLREAISQAATGEFVRYEVDLLGADNRIITIDFSLKPVKDETGQAVLLLPEGRDITQLKQAAQHELEEQTTNIWESMTDGFYTLDRNWRFTYVNPQAEQFLQRTRDQLLNRPIWEIYPEAVGTTFYHDYQQVMTQNISFHLEEFCSSLNSWFEVHAYPSKNGMSVYLQDITERKQAEEALYQREQEFRALAENSPDIIARIDKQLRHLYVNAAIEPVTGLSAQDFIGKTNRDLGMPEAQCDDWEEIAQQVLMTGVEHIVEFDFLSPDGITRYYQSRFVPEFARDGSIQSLLGISRDVTDFKQTADALRESQQLLQAILDATPQAIYIKDLQGRYILVNRHCERVLTLSREQILGKTDYDLFASAIADTWRTNDQAVLDAGSPLDFETVVPKPDGLHTAISLKFPLYDATGTAYAIAGISTDITQRKRAEEELYRREQEFRALAENSPDIIARHDRQGRHLYVNSAIETVTGLSPQAFIGKTNRELGMPEALCVYWDENFQQVFTTGQERTLEFSFPAADGTTRYFQNRVVPEFTLDGSVESVLAVGRDVTDFKQTEAALRENQQLLQAILDAAPVAIYLKDLRGRYLLVNPCTQQALGLTQEQIVGKSDCELMGQDAVDDWRSQEQAVLGAGMPVEIEDSFPQADGLHTYITTKFPLYDATGAAYAICGISTDITLRKQAEEALYRREQEFRALAENSPDIIARFDKQLRHLYVNAAVECATGLSPQSFIGKTHRDMGMPETMCLYLEENLQQVLTTGCERTIEVDFVTPDGTTRYYQSRLVPEFALDSSVESILTVARDVTDFKQAEAALHESEQKYRNLVETAQGLIWSVDSEGRFTFINQASKQFYGYEPEEMIGRKFTDFTILEQAQKDMEAVKRVLVGESLLHYETMALRKDGTPFYISANAIVLRDEAGNVLGTTGTSIDITERKGAEEQLKASLQEKEALLKEVHHRVKNNLQVISSLLDLQSQQIQEPIALEAFRSSQNRVRAIALIHETLYQSKNLARVNLADYIYTLTTYLLQTYPLNPNNITLQLNVDDIFFNLDQLIPCGLIINELISNALKHGFPENTKGTIWVELNSFGVASLEENAHQFTLIVGNDGIQLQDPQNFYTAQTLGFQLVNILVKQLGGEIEITQSRGTEFEIRFSDRDHSS